MNKKRITEFSIYLQAFMRRIVTRFQIPGIFLWWKDENGGKISRACSSRSWKSQISLIKLDPSVSDERQMDYFGVDDETKEVYTRGVCSVQKYAVKCYQKHLQRLLLYSSLKGELLSLLKDFYGSSFSAILWNNLNISRSHAFFLMKFYKIVK